jgi:hypothetical protein
VKNIPSYKINLPKTGQTGNQQGTCTGPHGHRTALEGISFMIHVAGILKFDPAKIINIYTFVKR